MGDSAGIVGGGCFEGIRSAPVVIGEPEAVLVVGV